MDNLHKFLVVLEGQLAVPCRLMNSIAASFRQAMLAGLSGKPSSLKMLPSFISCPTGREQGKIVAVDFGGTNVRVLFVELAGKGKTYIIDRRFFPLRDRLGTYDYTASSASGIELFSFIAGKIAEIVPPDGVYPLGHTFSFPCHQYGVNEAVLISWTKEIKTAGVEGQNVGQLLQQALARNKLGHVFPQAVINDTTGTLLAAAYNDADTTIGAICGTGHNSCYVEPCHPISNSPMIVNMESGNFDGIMQTKYDIILDQASEKPGAQRLEKIASGQYLGEIVRLIISELATNGHFPETADRLRVPYSLPTENLSTILADSSAELDEVSAVAGSCWGMRNLNASQLKAIHTIARLVTSRSARLVAATWAGVLWKIDPVLSRRHTIAVDGSLYEKMPGYAEQLAKAMSDILGEKAKLVTIRLSKDGSGIGAAIAAATVFKSV